MDISCLASISYVFVLIRDWLFLHRIVSSLLAFLPVAFRDRTHGHTRTPLRDVDREVGLIIRRRSILLVAGQKCWKRRSKAKQKRES
jgi:hypothetical protein